MVKRTVDREAWLAAVAPCSFRRYKANALCVDGIAAFSSDGARVGEAFAVPARAGKLLPSDWQYYLD